MWILETINNTYYLPTYQNSNSSLFILIHGTYKDIFFANIQKFRVNDKSFLFVQIIFTKKICIRFKLIIFLGTQILFNNKY